MKIIKTGVLVSTILFGIILWMTKAEFLPSQSAFALSDNVLWYYLMHSSIAAIFLLDGFESLDRDKELRAWWGCAIAASVLGIVAFDMYSYPMTHNIMTGIMATLAVGNVIYFASKKERPITIMNCFVGALCFVLGVLVWDFHLFFAEVIIEFTLGVAVARQIWIDK